MRRRGKTIGADRLLPASAVSGSGPLGNERIARGWLLASALILLALFSGLAVLSSSVRDSQARSRVHEVLPGKIAVVGSARLRLWAGDGFELTIPASWVNTVSGQVKYSNADDPQISRFVWAAPGGEGSLVLYVGKEYYKLSQLGDHSLATPRRAAIKDQSRTLSNKRRFPRPGDDLGTIVVGGERAMYRWLYSTNSRRAANFYFATCENGKRAQAWTIQTSAPIGHYDESVFRSIIQSLRTDQSPALLDGNCNR